eukprot:14523520-Ditylum_brightwellii.AAC.1
MSSENKSFNLALSPMEYPSRVMGLPVSLLLKEVKLKPMASVHFFARTIALCRCCCFVGVS